MLIFNLNIRGLGGGIKARYLRRVISSEEAEFVCLQETKTEEVTDARCFSLWGDNKVGWIHNGGVNGSGSLLSMWHKETFVYESHSLGKGFIATVGTHVKSAQRCCVVNVYAACNLREKKLLWEDLTKYKTASQIEVWCLCGDFNAVRSRDERKGVDRGNCSSEIKSFNEFIESNLLLEVPIVGKKYTWFKANGMAKSRIDRVLVSEEWMHKWPMCKQYVQRREVSDHCALMIKSTEKDWGPKPFRTIDAWFLERGFSEMVEDKWGSFGGHGNVIKVLKEKFKLLKADLKVWNKDVFGNLDYTKQSILQDIEFLDCEDSHGGLDESQRKLRSDLTRRLWENDAKIESLLRQKARINWFKYGDSCTRFFHSTLRWRRLRNEVKGVELGGVWCEEPCTVRQEAKKLFESRFKATKDFGVRLDGVEFNTLLPEVSSSMIEAFNEEEIKEAVWHCEGMKSPGPDGFNFNFIKKSWRSLKSDFVAALECFHATGVILKGCNASFIALIPKVKDPCTLHQFRPISLVGAIYKVISKVLAGRIKKVLPALIDGSQSAFIEGRGLVDSVVMANEVIEDIRRRGRRGLCLKVDFEKAYDSVSWNFLYDMLRRLGFHHVWIKWIRGCMESSTVSVLVNGSPTEEFKPSRGLRQGDPMAPFLFIIVAEGLAGLVRQAMKANLLLGVKVGIKEVEVAFLQFADDTLFFCEESWSNVVMMKAILRGFELASGLKINFHKSSIAGVNVQPNNLICYSKLLNCKQSGIPFKYLGLEVGGNPRKKSFWEPVLNKLKTRLSVWKGRFLSMAGRTCIIKSVLSAIPLFYISVFKAPEAIYKSIISIQRRFLWGWGKEKRPIAWVRWEDLCKPKKEGGLGIIDVRKFNYALLAKWRWRVISQDEGKWREVLESKYGVELECPQLPVKYQSWWWRDLVKVCREGGGEGWFQKEVHWKLGRGDKVRFWEDVWIGDTSLKSLFQRLYSLSVNQEHKIEDVGAWEGSEWKWKLEWRRDRFEWESELEANLFEFIVRADVKKTKNDIRVWGTGELEMFSVNVAYKVFLMEPEKYTMKLLSLFGKPKHSLLSCQQHGGFS